jgi:molecular chaperone GrpE
VAEPNSNIPDPDMPDTPDMPDISDAPETQPRETGTPAPGGGAKTDGKPGGRHSAKKPKGDAAKLAALEEKLTGAQAKITGGDEAFKRLAAEYDNFRKRSQKERDTAFSNGVAHAAETLLPVLDALEAAAHAETADTEYKKGVLMTLTKAGEIFEKLGIEEIDAKGRPFDPELHNACLQEPCEGMQSGCVSKVVQKGYTLSGRVIRHAIVAVAE